MRNVRKISLVSVLLAALTACAILSPPVEAQSPPISSGDPLVSNPPANGTYRILSALAMSRVPPPFPFNPCADCPVRQLPDGSFLVDDSATNLSFLYGADPGPDSQSGRSGLERLSQDGANGLINFPEGSLYLEITGVSNYAGLVLHGTQATSMKS
jgi:hypothetical protein